MRPHRLHLVAFSFCLLSLLTSSVTAQSHWWFPERGSAITIELQKPHYNLPEWWVNNRGILNSVGFVGVRYQISNDMAVFWELPFANQDVDDEPRPIDILSSYEYWMFFYQESQFMIGNPLFGVEHSIAGPSFFVRASFRLPIASEEKLDALALGWMTSYDRWEAFLPKVSTLKLDVGWRESEPTTPLVAQLTLGSVAMVPDEGDTELLADYSAFVGLNAGCFEGGGFFGGRFIMTEDPGEFSERFVNFCGLTSRLKLGAIEPGVHVRLNLDDDLNDLVDYTYGFSLAVPIGKANMTDQKD
jgi:hypothetical protein